LSHNGASDAQASVYLWVGVAIGIYVRAQVCKPAHCTKCNSPPINGQCTNFISFDVTL